MGNQKHKVAGRGYLSHTQIAAHNKTGAEQIFFLPKSFFFWRIMTTSRYLAEHTISSILCYDVSDVWAYDPWHLEVAARALCYMW